MPDARTADLSGTGDPSGKGGAGGGAGGNKADAGGGGKGGKGGSSATDAPPLGPAADAAKSDPDGQVGPAGDAGGSSPTDVRAGDPADAAPVVMRPDAMGAPCAMGGGYNFTVKTFPAQTGTFTAFFTASPGKAPTNSVIGLSGGAKYLHDDFSAIVRFSDKGNLDARNGTGYMSLTPIVYKDTDYHFRLVLNVPAHTYSAYVTFDGMPEVTLGTNFAFRDTAATPTMLDHWGVEAIGGHSTKVCGFQVQ